MNTDAPFNSRIIAEAPEDEPRQEYSRRLESWKAVLGELGLRDRRLGTIKLALGGVTVLMAGIALATKLISAAWVTAPLLVIIVLAVIHSRVLKRRVRCAGATAYYERALGRIENRWMGTGETGERFQNDSHNYSRDLDLFGHGSMFQLLSAARTAVGQETLAHWLLRPASPEVVRARQAAIAELRQRLDLREDVAVLAEQSVSGMQADALASWGEGQPTLPYRVWRSAAAALAGLWVLSLVYWMFRGSPLPALIVSSINAGLNAACRPRIRKALSALEPAARGLGLLAGVLARLETEQFAAPRLVEIRASLAAEGRQPSEWIARLKRLIEHLDSRRNMLVAGIDPFVFWTWQCACAVEDWRGRTGHAVRRWLSAVGEFEALSSLAGYAYEHPADVFPEFTTVSPWFEAEGMTHPLLPESTAVRNDLHFGGELRVLIISGPNMAGKSTFIRAVGINAVLAQCGAPVRARRLRLSPLAVGASICVLDSLQGGVSRFYAEIRRLKQITDLTQGPVAVMFLLDEFLGGTNSQDRRVGSEAMIRNLVAHGAIGLVTTHDLALAQIADGLGSLAGNAHFEDRIEDGKLIFDHRLKPGIVSTSNALNLMRSIGLDV